MIEVRNVSKRIGDREVLREVTFEARPGGVTGFLGPNGAGKTTTMRILTTLLGPDGGSATVAGHDVLDEPMAVRRAIGYLPEQPALLLDHTVEESLRFRAGLHGLGGRRVRRRIDETLALCSLEEVARRRVGALSRGVRQRVGLAQALVHDPSVVILDEPTAGLDPVQVLETRGKIAELARDRTVLLSTHVLSEVTAICEAVVVIHRGSIVAREPVAALGRGSDLEETFVAWTAGTRVAEVDPGAAP